MAKNAPGIDIVARNATASEHLYKQGFPVTTIRGDAAARNGQRVERRNFIVRQRQGR